MRGQAAKDEHAAPGAYPAKRSANPGGITVFAGKLLEEETATAEQRLKHAFRAVTSRLPDDRELQLLSGILAENKTKFAASAEDTEAFLAVGEATYNESIDPTELAAYTVAVSAIFNMYEAVMKS